MSDHRYPDSWSVRAGRARYFETSGFDTQTYTDRWIKLSVGAMNVYLPNLPARKRAVVLHDIDHVLTEYDASWRGEFEIAAFELGMGLGRYWFGWFIHCQTLLMGAPLAPRATLEAYVRGRRCHTSLFDRDGVDDALLETTIGAIRAEIGLDKRTGPPTLKERAAYARTVATALIVNAAPLLLAGWAIWTVLS